MGTLLLTDLERPGPGLRKILDELARQIAADAENLQENPAVRVHDIRVATKKIRSLLQLTSSEIVEEQRSDLTVSLRKIRDAFAGSRDDEAMRQRLGQIFSKKKATDIAKKLGLAATEDYWNVDIAPAAASGSKLSAQLAALDLDPLQPNQLLEAASRSYGRARKVMRKCLKSPRDEAMHDWRKRVKDVSYHAVALSTLPLLGKISPPMDKLAESLGEYHDLAVLGERTSHLKKVAAKVSTAKSKVGRRCFKAGKKLFEPSGRKFASFLKHALRELQTQ